MTPEEIKALALKCGFSEREQPGGGMDLNPYVYRFAQALLDRRPLQEIGAHPAPCARFCEATAYEIEIRRLRFDARTRAEAIGALLTGWKTGEISGDDVAVELFKRYTSDPAIAAIKPPCDNTGA